jgi:hypothetical protein
MICNPRGAIKFLIQFKKTDTIGEYIPVNQNLAVNMWIGLEGKSAKKSGCSNKSNENDFKSML